MSKQNSATLLTRPHGNGKLARRQMVKQVLECAPSAELAQALAHWKQMAASSHRGRRNHQARLARRAFAAMWYLRKHNNVEQTRHASNRISGEDTLILALSEGQIYSPDEALRLELEAQQRAFSCREALLRGSRTAPQVASLLGTTRQTPHDRAQSQTLLAIQDRGSLRFPYWQFDANGPNGVIAGLPAVLKALDISPLGKVSWLTRPNPYMEGRTPLETLKAGEVERVVDQARAVGAGG